MTHDPHPQQAEHKEPYRTTCVVLAVIGLATVPTIALLGHRRIAVLWVVDEILMLAIVRLQRPDGTWLAARSRLFDVVLGIGLVAVLMLLSPYVNLPRIVRAGNTLCPPCESSRRHYAPPRVICVLGVLILRSGATS